MTRDVATTTHMGIRLPSAVVVFKRSAASPCRRRGQVCSIITTTDFLASFHEILNRGWKAGLACRLARSGEARWNRLLGLVGADTEARRPGHHQTPCLPYVASALARRRFLACARAAGAGLPLRSRRGWWRWKYGGFGGAPRWRAAPDPCRGAGRVSCGALLGRRRRWNALKVAPPHGVGHTERPRRVRRRFDGHG
jgi:hypothetical protein